MFTKSQSYWDKQDTSYSCADENMAYEPAQFYKYHYQLLLPYLAPGTALYDGYPFAIGCVGCVTAETRPTGERLPKIALSAAVAAALISRKRSSKDTSPPPPPWDHTGCYTPCGDGDCASMGASFSCEDLALFGCDCAGCCTATSPPPRPPAPPSPPVDACLTSPCGSSDCASMGASFTCAELALFGCNCNGCCSSS